MGIVKKRKQLSYKNLLAKAQRIFNTFIRERDRDKGCISCGAMVTEAGHYRSAGHYSALRFNEMNTNGQCTRCNCFLSGNLINYRSGLVKRYGEQKVLMLEASGRNVKRWATIELELICIQYGKKQKA